MSYSIGLYLKQCKSFEDGFLTAFEAKNLLVENKVEYIYKNVGYSPSVNFDKSNPMADRFWLYSLFSMKFIFFKKYNILCLSGFDYPEAVEELFDGHVHFQNHSDQDYPLSEWPDKINLFKDIKNIVTSESTEETSEMRQVMYDYVKLQLDLDAYIGRQERPDIKVFVLNGIEHEFLHSNMNVILKKAIYDEMEKEIADLAEMVAPQLIITDDVLESGIIVYKDKEYQFGDIKGENKAFEIAKEIIKTNYKNSGKMN